MDAVVIEFSFDATAFSRRRMRLNANEDVAFITRPTRFDQICDCPVGNFCFRRPVSTANRFSRKEKTWLSVRTNRSRDFRWRTKDNCRKICLQLFYSVSTCLWRRHGVSSKFWIKGWRHWRRFASLSLSPHCEAWQQFLNVQTPSREQLQSGIYKLIKSLRCWSCWFNSISGQRLVE